MLKPMRTNALAQTRKKLIQPFSSLQLEYRALRPLGGSHLLTSFLKRHSSYGLPRQLHARWRFLKGKRHSLALRTNGCNRYTAFIGISANGLQSLLRKKPILIQAQRPACVILIVAEYSSRFLLRLLESKSGPPEVFTGALVFIELYCTILRPRINLARNRALAVGQSA